MFKKKNKDYDIREEEGLYDYREDSRESSNKNPNYQDERYDFREYDRDDIVEKGDRHEDAYDSRENEHEYVTEKGDRHSDRYDNREHSRDHVVEQSDQSEMKRSSILRIVPLIILISLIISGLAGFFYYTLYI